MKLAENQIMRLVSDSLGVFTNGVHFRDSGIYISLNLPDGTKTSIQGEWSHMSDLYTLSERVIMLQHVIYEEFPDYHICIPREWER
jgi:hypothetical protein